MSDIKDVLDRARGEAQDLHKKIEANTAKHHAELRTDVQNAAAQAQHLAASLKTVAAGRHDEAKAHLDSAVSELEGIAKHGRELAGASEAQLKEANRAMLQKAQRAVQSVSHAIATQRPTAGKA